MSRTQMTCYTMLATAIVLTALILLQASRMIDSTAHAEMAIHKDSVTMITTPSPAGGDDVLYILDARSGNLFAYTLNNSRVESFAVLDIGRLFQAQAGGAAGARPRR